VFLEEGKIKVYWLTYSLSDSELSSDPGSAFIGLTIFFGDYTYFIAYFRGNLDFYYIILFCRLALCILTNFFFLLYVIPSSYIESAMTSFFILKSRGVSVAKLGA
jgi:hypothetical protein